MATERNVLFKPKTDDEIEVERQADLKAWRKDGKEADIEESSYYPGTYACHEAFHTSWLMLESVAGSLLEHPSIILDPVWYKHAFKAHDQLFRLTQEMGAGHASLVPNEERKAKKMSVANRRKAEKREKSE